MLAKDAHTYYDKTALIKVALLNEVCMSYRFSLALASLTSQPCFKSITYTY